MSPSCSESTRRAVLAAGLLSALALPACAPLSVPEEQQLGRQMSRELRSELVFVRDPIVVDYVEDLGKGHPRRGGPATLRVPLLRRRRPGAQRLRCARGPHLREHGNDPRSEERERARRRDRPRDRARGAYRHVANNYNRQRDTGILYQVGVFAAWLFGGGIGRECGAARRRDGGVGVSRTPSGARRRCEADAFAVDAMPRADYDPNGLVTFFQTIKARGRAERAGLSLEPPGHAGAHRRDPHADRGSCSPGGSLRIDDGGKLEIIQRRIEILTGTTRGQSKKPRY